MSVLWVYRCPQRPEEGTCRILLELEFVIGIVRH